MICENCGWETAQVGCTKCGMGGQFLHNVHEHPDTYTCESCGTSYPLPHEFYDKPIKLRLLSKPRSKPPKSERRKIFEATAKRIVDGIMVILLTIPVLAIGGFLITYTFSDNAELWFIYASFTILCLFTLPWLKFFKTSTGLPKSADSFLFRLISLIKKGIYCWFLIAIIIAIGVVIFGIYTVIKNENHPVPNTIMLIIFAFTLVQMLKELIPLLKQ